VKGKGVRQARKKWVLIIAPAAFLLKDIIATMAVLSTEPGITPKAALYYSVALLPGTLIASPGAAMLFNVLIGVLIGWILYRLVIRRKKTSEPHVF
jgi:hypothetical protein